MKNFIFIANLGFNIVTPLLICIFLTKKLVDKFALPDFFIIISIFVGIFSGVYLVFRQLFGENGVYKK